MSLVFSSIFSTKYTGPIEYFIFHVATDVEIGKITGWIVDLDNNYDILHDGHPRIGLKLFKKFAIDQQLKGRVWFFEGFETYPEYQGKQYGSEAGKLHQDAVQCDYLVGYPYPLYSKNKSAEEIKKDSEFLTRYYIDYHTYKGKWKKVDGTDIIMKKILE